MPSRSARSRRSREFFRPKLDVFETLIEYVVDVELPGLHDRNRTSIEFNGQILHICGTIERSEVGEIEPERSMVVDEEEYMKESLTAGGGGGDENKFLVSERMIGTFRRSYTFPGDIDVDRAKANLDHGVLRIVVPKVSRTGLRRIQIQ